MKKRFVIEYTNYKMQQIQERKTFSDHEKVELCRKATKAAFAVEHGLITIDECMKILAEL